MHRRAIHRIAVAWAAWFLIMAAAAMPAQAQDWIAAAQTHMSRLETELAALGPARIDDGALAFGTRKIGNARCVYRIRYRKQKREERGAPVSPDCVHISR